MRHTFSLAKTFSAEQDRLINSRHITSYSGQYCCSWFPIIIPSSDCICTGGRLIEL